VYVLSEITDIKAREVLDSRGKPTKPFTKALREKILRTTFAQNTQSGSKKKVF